MSEMHCPSFIRSIAAKAQEDPRGWVTEWVSTDNHDLHRSHRKWWYTLHSCQNAGEGQHIFTPFNAQRLTSSCGTNKSTTNESKWKGLMYHNRSSTSFLCNKLEQLIIFHILWRQQHTINQYVGEHTSPAKRMRSPRIVQTCYVCVHTLTFIFF